MASLDPKFILEKPNIDIETYIMVVLRYNYKRIKISTGDKILPIYWDKEDQRPTTDKKILRNAKPLLLKKLKYISLHLDEIDYFINDLILDLKKDKTISLDIIKDKLIDFLGRKKEELQPETIKLIPYYDSLIERMEKGMLITNKGGLYTPGTIKSHRVYRNQIAGFEDEWGKITFDSITNELYIQLISYFHSKKYKQNTIGRAIKSLKFVMKTAYKEKLHNNEIFKDEDFRAVMTDVDNIYLTDRELDKLYNLDLSNDKVKERARDLFLIGCYTAQRFSDFSRFRPEHIKTTTNGIKVIDIVTKKTKQRVIIPFVFPKLETLLSKYDYRSPKTYEQDLNEQIKEIGKLAGLNEKVIISDKIGGKMVDTVFFKYELIKTHTARRSGATNLFKMGYAPLEIMKITGHTSEATFINYIKVSKEENAELMMAKQVDKDKSITK